MSRAWRVYHPGELRAGATIELSAEEGHHVRRVLRLRPGQSVGVFDGRGAEWSGVLAPAGAGPVRVQLGRTLTPTREARLPVLVYQGACRAERLAWVVQKATEVGVMQISPLDTARGAARPPDARGLARLQRIAVEACKQSGRSIVPRIEPQHELPPIGTGSLGLLLDADPGHPPLARVLAGPEPSQVSIAVGPEEGFDGGEIETARSAGWRPAGLGARVLRTETAALVVAAIVLHRWGDLGTEPG